MIIVLDTNIWVSLALNKQLDYIAFLRNKGALIAGCKNLNIELNDVFSRPKFNKRFTSTFIKNFERFYQYSTVNFELSEIENVVADDKDNYLFALCKITNADFLITGDKLL